MLPDLTLERLAGGVVAGIDEAGRGPWAGPVVAAAVVLPEDGIDGLNDSKKLTARRREVLFDEISARAAVGVGLAEVEEIDRINILRATDAAMCRALAELGQSVGHVLVDGNRVPAGLATSAEAVVKGDARSASIAAASIIAKVSRDRIMSGLARAFPQYGWERNAGYGTAEHRAGLEMHGVSPHHRRSFAPIRNILI